MKKKVSDIRSIDKSKLEQLYQRLNPYQREYLSKKKDMIPSLAARYILCGILNEEYGTDLAESLASDNKGRLIVCGRDDIFVSISHSDRYVAAAVSRRPVGIDIEVMRPISEKLCRRVCKKAAGEEEFFRIWTSKEAYLKATGISYSQMLGMSVEELPDSIITEKQNMLIVATYEVKDRG